MAIKERTLRKLSIARSNLNLLRKHGAEKVLPNVVCALKDANDLARRGLPKRVYGEYSSIFVNVIGSLEQVLCGMDMGEQSEVLGLSSNLITYIADKLEQENNFKKEIMFLPYKVTMFDSMESVWQAAVDDSEHAIPYVMPIPYFDRDTEGNVREWHCETSEFPKYVPVIDYRHIDLAEMHPDVIVIHNSYDDYNIVTSVGTEYYSRNLRKYTDKLVYIPYFVLEEVDPTDGVALGNIAHFVLTPGVYNADLTIVQSEDMRKAYVEILTQLSEVKDRSYWEKRILGLGSPKIDKVLSTKRENVKLPENWRRIIEKPDGTRKKIIFYNVSLASLLEHEDKLLDKMESVFNVFRERQNEVALLWRPHPLFVSTLESMKPELLARYRSMVERYRNEGWGIYDDTAELHRSIAISDAYYGDRSSIITLFQATRKPIMLQNVSMIHFPFTLVCSNFKEGQAFFFEINRAVLGTLNFHSKQIDVISVLQRGGYLILANIDDKLILFPGVLNSNGCANEVTEYYPSTGKIKYISLQVENKPIKSAYPQYFGCAKYGDSIYFMGDVTAAIVKYDGLTDTYTPMYNWRNKMILAIGKVMQNDLGWKGFSSPFIIDNKLYVAISNTNKVVEFNLNTECVVVYSLGDDRYHLLGMVYDSNNKFILFSSNVNAMIVWDFISNSTHELKSFASSLESMGIKGRLAFTALLLTEEDVYLFPTHLDCPVFVVDKHTGEVISHHKVNYIRYTERMFEKNCASSEGIYFDSFIDNIDSVQFSRIYDSNPTVVVQRWLVNKSDIIIPDRLFSHHIMNEKLEWDLPSCVEHLCSAIGKYYINDSFSSCRFIGKVSYEVINN